MKTCIVTGAGSGIGRATSIQLSFANQFDNIVLIGRDKDNLNLTKDRMNKSINTLIYQHDLIDLAGIPLIVKDVKNKCFSIDCLLNIAGYTEPASIFETTIDNLQKTYTINVFALIIFAKECAKYMKNCDDIPKILNVASTAGITSRPGWLSYASSKAAVIAVSQTLADELAEYNIKVYCISPGRCATALRRKLAPEEDQSVIMQPEDVSSVICNLINTTEYCLDGQNIAVRKRMGR